MLSYDEPKFIEKLFWEIKVFLFSFSKFGPKSKWREIKIGYLAAIFKRYNILFFLSNYDFFIVCTYTV